MAKVHSILKTKAANGELQEHLLATTTVLIEDAGQPGGVATLNANGDLKQMPTLAQVGGKNKNLARNCNWAHPVNLRDITTQVWDGHNIEGWHTYSAGTNTFTLEVIPGSHLHIVAGNHWLQQGQRYEYLPNGVYTLSVKLLNGTIYSKTVTWDGSTAVGGDVIPGLGLWLANSIGYPYFYVNLLAGYTFDIVSVGIEEGAVLTLTHDVFASYASELVECQRFYRKVVFKAYCFNVNGSNATLQCGVYYPDMRTKVSTANLLISEIIDHGIGNRVIGTLQSIWSDAPGWIMEITLSGSNLQVGHWYTVCAAIDCNI